MRSALICVFLALFVPKDGSCGDNDEYFRPTPIPLSDWPRDKQETAGTLQEITKTEAPPTVAAVPAHYWEDALKHSVYLTLVRDKIDQLIEKGEVISPDSRPDSNMAKEIDDHDLWEKIKTARFDRLKEEPIPPGDVTILARGRLIEENNGYRFAEDNTTSNCSSNDCTKGVKAYWSVKRMKQEETSPGKYHYELTFSVTSHTRRKLKKPYENPVRTFTIKENSPTDRPEIRYHDQIYHHVQRPQRAIWVHRNINPSQKRQIFSRGLDRIFSSLFSDEDSYEEPSFRHKPKSYAPQVYPQHAKVGYIEDREPYHQKKLVPYPMMKPQAYRYTHSPIPPPPVNYVQNPYFNMDPLGNMPYVSQYTDNRFMPSNVVRTTRPAVLPTPITNYSLQKESTVEVPVKSKLNATEYTTKSPDAVTTYKMYNHHKQSMKVNYFPDHIRPPVYNAPPGVFVTMDKKPFKPLPPLKFGHSSKPQKMLPPDFRPSPQVLDNQFSEQDSSVDSAFRPITMNYTEVSHSQESNDKGRKSNKNNRKPSVAKKTTKKHENIKSKRLTTVSPEIITALSQSIEEDPAMEWANLLGAFTKTTPMASHRDRGTTESNDTITTITTPLSITFTEESFEDTESSSEDVTQPSSTTTTTTTPKPKKRTRPPPKFTKQEKTKKHKRVMSTSTSSTTSTTTTAKPTRKYTTKKASDDLTPQASSAATSATNSIWETKTHKAPIATTTTSTTPRPTTTIKLTTTTTTSTTSSTPSTIVDTEQPIATTQPKSKNRFRQSTLMHKGTSVNHDKWSTITLEKNRTTSLNSKFPLRRKASKFQGYIPSSTPRSPEVERNKQDHRDHVYNSNDENNIKTTTEQSDDSLGKAPVATQPTYEEQEINNERPAEWHNDDETEEDDDNEAEQKDTEAGAQESKDDKEYIYPTTSTSHELQSEYISLEKRPITTEVTVATSPNSAVNKTKCKKKKHNNLSTTQETKKPSDETETSPNIITSSTTTTASAVTPDIFADLFGGFTMDDATEKPKRESLTPPPEPNQSESEKHERYVHIDDDLEDFLHSLDQKSNHHPEEDKSEEEYDNEDNDNEDSPFNNEEENSDSRNLSDEYYDESQESQDRQFSLLELMAME